MTRRGLPRAGDNNEADALMLNPMLFFPDINSFAVGNSDKAGLEDTCFVSS